MNTNYNIFFKKNNIYYAIVIVLVLLTIYLILNPSESFTTNETIYPKTLYIVWRNKIDTRMNDGLGFKLFGAIYAFQFCKENNINLKIDATDDICSDFLKNVVSNEYEDIKTKDVLIFKSNDNVDSYSILKQKLETADKLYIYTNQYPKYQLNEEDKNFAKFLLQPKPELQTVFEAKIATLPANYGVKHFRFNDDIFSVDIDFNDTFYAKYFKLLEDSYATTDVVISNSKVYKQYVKMMYFEKYKTKISTVMCDNDSCNIQHIGTSTDLESLKNSFIDFYIICNAKYIKSYTSYNWPCNFVYLPALLYNIPFESSYIT